MKKVFLIVGIVFLVGLFAVAVVVGQRKKTDTNTGLTSSNSSTGSSSSSGKYAACKILTSKVATTLLGSDVKVVTVIEKGDSETKDLKITNCSFVASDNVTSVTMRVREAKTQLQASANATQFAAQKNVTGYGSLAYWDSTYGQFNIFAHNNWYVLTYGLYDPATRTQSQALTYADLIKSKV